MSKARREILVEVGMCVDIAVCSCSLLLAVALLHEPLWRADVLLLRQPLRVLAVTVPLGLLWHVSLRSTAAYKSYRLIGMGAQAAALARGTGLAAIWVWAWFRLSSSESSVSNGSMLVQVLTFWLLSLSGLVATRLLARLITHFLRRRGRNLRNVLIVGSNRRAVGLADGLLKRPELGLHLVGFVDDAWTYEDAPLPHKAMLLGTFSDFLALLRNLAVDEVIITLPIASMYQLSQQIILWCRQQGIPVRSEGSLFDVDPGSLPLSTSVAELITHHEVVHGAWSVLFKRLVDIVVSSLAVVLLLPVMLLIALAIRLTSPGPILFAQERLGMNKRRFRISKFRTMVVDAEQRMAQVEHLNQSQGPTFKLKNDPRITGIGSFLRKTSLDELPQLINVLQGDMSLVGPRPLPLRDYNGLSADWHRRRFSVKPGITCLWQITGRSSIGFDRWMELDMDYIDRWSIWLDLEILIKTIPAVLRGTGAV